MLQDKEELKKTKIWCRVCLLTHLSSNLPAISVACVNLLASIPSKSAITKPSAESILVASFSNFFLYASTSSGEKLPPPENNLEKDKKEILWWALVLFYHTFKKKV